MTGDQQLTAASATGILSAGYRPFFLAAGVWAATAIALWTAMLPGWISLPTAFDPVSWHAHEALFGYLGAVLAGFLLTAVPNWTGRPPLTGWPLLCLFVLWLLGRVSVGISEFIPPVAVAALDLSGLMALGAYALREIVNSRNWRNLVIIAILSVFVCGNALFHWEASNGGHPATGLGMSAGIAAAVMMISLVGGRIIPAFTRNWLAARGSEFLPAEFGWIDRLALALALFALANWVAFPAASGTGYFLLAAGAATIARFSRWRGLDTGGEPLLWILHVGYSFVPLGMLGVGLTVLWPDILPFAAAKHLWMAGAIGIMTIAVMTRATLGHGGRALTASAGTAAVYLMVVCSVLTRFAGGVMPQQAMAFWIISGMLWFCGFAGFVLLYGRLLIGMRPA